MTDLNGNVWVRWHGSRVVELEQQANSQEAEARGTPPSPAVGGRKRSLGQGRHQRRKQLRWQGTQLRTTEAGDGTGVSNRKSEDTQHRTRRLASLEQHEALLLQTQEAAANSGMEQDV